MTTFFIAPNCLGYPLNTALKSSYAFLIRSSSCLLNFLGCLAFSMKRRPSSPYIGIVGLGSKHSIDAISAMYFVFILQNYLNFSTWNTNFWISENLFWHPINITLRANKPIYSGCASAFKRTCTRLRIVQMFDFHTTFQNFLVILSQK